MTTRFAPSVPEDARFSLVDRLIPGNAAPMRQMKRLVEMLAPSDAPVLVTGPSGAGKELVAQALHRLSGRKGQFVAINCAALPAELLEGELFGTERGAYTGADRARAGLIEQAEGGTLFLDEIGDMPLPLQAKLLRVLETRTLRRLGGAAPVSLDFRVVAATHRDLSALAASGDFREDLMFRLAVFPLSLPSLAERLSDLPLILSRLLDDCAGALPAVALPQFDETALRALAGHHWPGNVRELRSIVQRACLMFAGQRITAREVRDNLLRFAPPLPAGAPAAAATQPLPAGAALPCPEALRAALAETPADLDLRIYLRDIEVTLIEAALERCKGCVAQAAEALRLRRTTLIEKMRKYGIERPA